MTTANIRQIVTTIEETHREMGKEISPPTRKVVVAAVIQNPCAGRFVQDLEPLKAIGAELGGLLGKRAVAALGVEPGQIQCYGKSAIIGEAGELEHGAAVLHPRLGKPLREAVETGASIIPSTNKLGGIGTTIDVPLHNKNDEWSFDHVNSILFSIEDAPRANEIVVVIAVTDSGRPLARVLPETSGAIKK